MSDAEKEVEKKEKAEGAPEWKAVDKVFSAVAAKARGTEAYKKGEYADAVKGYSEAIALCDTDHVVHSNRSAAYASQQLYTEALHDAEKCVELKPDWAKGYARLGFAHFHLGRLEDAKQAYLEGLKQDPKNQAMKDGLKEVESFLTKDQPQETPKDTRRKRSGFKGTFQKLINPLGLSTKGAVTYAVIVITVVALFVLWRANQFKNYIGQSEGANEDL